MTVEEAMSFANDVSNALGDCPDWRANELQIICAPMDNGKVRMLFQYMGDNSLSDPVFKEYVYRGNASIESVRRSFLKKVAPVLHRQASWLRLLCISRESGLLTKAFLQEQSTMLTEFFPYACSDDHWKKDPRALNLLSRRLGVYIKNYAKCPHCRAHECFVEELAGWTCGVCGTCWVDVYPRAARWVDPDGVHLDPVSYVKQETADG